ncbi:MULTISPECIES: hypothetical protein [Haloarcula]|uniref:hypothetical protein n=1 Tax=Haloarcula TaxID=2237 RepID=UPI0023EC6532|nr:hypothetical protein [Halomicroarcula sp. XH51]
MNAIVTELADLLLSLVAAGLLTVVGALTESAGLANLLAGQSMLGLWELWMGAIALYAGVYLLGYKRIVARVTSPSN